MNDNQWLKKEKPMQGMGGFWGGVGSNLVSGAPAPPDPGEYIDNIFSTWLYDGTSSAQTIVNGIDLANEGGMVWTKDRTDNGYDENALEDTVRGVGKELWSNSVAAETYHAQRIQSFTSSGYTMGTSARYNDNGQDYVSWTFRKEPGFFDILTWTGDNSNLRTISHSLGCVPGLIIIKSTTYDNATYGAWSVYHRDMDSATPANYVLRLNTDAARVADTDFANTQPSSTHITLGTQWEVNKGSEDYVAYVFAGGESQAATARSVDFDGHEDYLTQTCDAVLRNWWDQAFTVEYWFNADGFVSSGNSGPGVLGVCAPTSNGETWSFGPKSDGLVEFYYWNGSIQRVTTTRALQKGQWYHLAMVYDGSSSIKIYVNGVLEKSATKQGTPTGTSTVFSIGKIANGDEFNGRVSNVRITHQALYTTSFKPPVEPLTQTSQGATSSNVKLLCCNNSSTTGSTVTPATISANGDPTANTQSPFDDPKGFIFGEGADSNVIKCGGYKGNSSTDFEVYCGWEPQYIMFKSKSGSYNWSVFDCMRGIFNGEDEKYLYPNLTNPEYTAERISLTPTGFIVDSAAGVLINENDGDYIFVAIRRPDGYCGKPAAAGTNAFTQNLGTSNSNVPAFVSGFPVDFSFNRQFAGTENWWNQTRLTGTQYLIANATDAETNSVPNKWDYMNGWYSSTSNLSAYVSWMWKRGKGFDVVTYTGDGSSSNRQIAHSMNNAPGMIIIKSRSNTQPWAVYHTSQGASKYFDGIGTGDISSGNTRFGGVEPTSTYFTVGTSGDVNYDTYTYEALLFSSVTGLSKCGSYTGNGSSTERTITLGFQPRFIIVKNASSSGHDWQVLDTLRGWASGVDNRLFLNTTAAQTNSQDIGQPTATGFTLTTTNTSWNNDTDTFIYYAHA